LPAAGAGTVGILGTAGLVGMIDPDDTKRSTPGSFPRSPRSNEAANRRVGKCLLNHGFVEPEVRKRRKFRSMTDCSGSFCWRREGCQKRDTHTLSSF
jgi:hypothetical protein